MREIKFRAWDGKHKKMFYGVGFLNGVWTLPNGLKLTTTNNVMQFTNLYDKEGKEIYEWDILKSPQFGVKIVGNTPEDLVGIKKYAGRAEVIGDVYSNPELLK